MSEINIDGKALDTDKILQVNISTNSVLWTITAGMMALFAFGAFSLAIILIIIGVIFLFGFGTDWEIYPTIMSMGWGYVFLIFWEFILWFVCGIIGAYLGMRRHQIIIKYQKDLNIIEDLVIYGDRKSLEADIQRINDAKRIS